MGQTPSKITGYFRYKDGQRYDLTDHPVERTYYNNTTTNTTNINTNEMTRHILVTGGATVPFEELLLEAITPAFFAALRAHGFTHVHLQCHNFLASVQRRLDDMATQDRAGLEVNIFDFDLELKQTMQHVCRPEDGVRLAGFVLGHAGTGTIADAMESEVAIVIVANQNLMHNHQARFATHIAGEYPNIIEGKLGLAETIPKVLEMIDQNGLDHLEPLQEEVLPLGEGGLNFIDQVINGF